jgi:hypothetical protein
MRFREGRKGWNSDGDICLRQEDRPSSVVFGAEIGEIKAGEFE